MEGNISGDIKKHRERMGLTQEQLADSLNINRKTVGEWESGKSKPNKTSRKDLSNLFSAEVTLKGIKETHINNMKLENPEKLDNEDWYKKTIESLIHMNGEGFKEFRESKKEEIEELKQDKIRLHQHLDKLITRVNPSHNAQ